MKLMRSTFASLTLASVLATTANASTINVDFMESATGVTLSGAGTFDTTGLSEALSNFSTSGLIFVSPVFGSFGAGAVALADTFSLSTAYTPFGPSDLTLASSGSGDAFGLLFCGTSTDTCVMLPDNYTSNDPLAFSAQFAGQSFASLGITATSPISLAFGSNEVNLSFSPLTAVPLPAGLPLLLAGIGGLGLISRRKRVSGRIKAA